MDREIQKAIEETELAYKAYIQECINTLLERPHNKKNYEEMIEMVAQSKIMLEKLGLKVTITEFEFTYSVYAQTLNPKTNKKPKIPKLKISELDRKLLRSIKIIPPDDEENKS